MVLLIEHDHQVFADGDKVVMGHFKPAPVGRSENKPLETIAQALSNVFQIHAAFFARNNFTGKPGNSVCSASLLVESGMMLSEIREEVKR